jgi:hypothetical protein
VGSKQQWQVTRVKVFFESIQNSIRAMNQLDVISGQHMHRLAKGFAGSAAAAAFEA